MAELLEARAECARSPGDPEAWLACARAARAAGAAAESVGALYRASRILAQTGALVRAAGLVERLLLLDPGHAAGRRLQMWLGDLGIHSAPADLDALEVADPAAGRFAEGSGQLPAAVRAGYGVGDTTARIAFSHLDDGSQAAPPDLLDLDVVDAVASVLASSPLLRELSSDLVRYVQESAASVRYPEGSVLVSEGDRGSSLFVLLRGRVAVERGHLRGKIRRLAELTPGAFFGEMAALTGAPRSATIVALTDVDVLELAGDSLRILVERSPRLYALLMRYCRARAIASILTASSWFAEMSVEAKRALAGEFFVRELAAGSVALRPGERLAGPHFVALGRLALSRSVGTGTARREIGPGDVFGSGGVSHEEVRAIDPSWVLVLPAHLAARLPAVRGRDSGTA